MLNRQLSILLGINLLGGMYLFQIYSPYVRVNYTKILPLSFQSIKWFSDT